MRSLTAGEARRGEGVKVKLRRNASISYFLGRGGGGVLLLHGEHLVLIQPKHPNWGTIQYLETRSSCDHGRLCMPENCGQLLCINCLFWALNYRETALSMI